MSTHTSELLETCFCGRRQEQYQQSTYHPFLNFGLQNSQDSMPYLDLYRWGHSEWLRILAICTPPQMEVKVGFNTV